MNIYVSCPHSFSEGLDKVLKYLSYYVVDSVTCNRKGESYDFSLLEQADCVVFIIDRFKWQEKLENISRGMLHELIYCLNHKKSFYLAYQAADGMNIYGAQITPDLVLSGIAGTKGNIFKLQDSEPVLQTFGKLYIDSAAKVIPGVTKIVDKMNELGINYELEETPKSTNSYFY